MQSAQVVLVLAAATLWFAAALAQDAGVEEVVVTGTYVRRQSPVDSLSPLVILSAADLAATGANDVGSVIEDLTINTGSQNHPDAFTQNLTTGTSNVNLRGLGVSSTLVLLNGRRQTQSAVATDRGENFVDTSSLPPLIAFERVELLKDGATALYGSEAVAGVVNFITRSGFDGFDVEVGVQDVDRYPQEDRQIAALYGTGNDRTHLLVALDHLDREMLTTEDRRLSGRTDDLSQAGMPGSFLVPSLPGNPAFRSVWTAAFDSNGNGVADFVEPTLGLPAVPGAQPPVFADQTCRALAAQDPTVVPNIAASAPSAAGLIDIGLCELDFGGFYSIVPRETRNSGYLELRRKMKRALTGRLELHAASNHAVRNNSPSFPFAAFPTVAASHPDNPYGSDVRFIGRIIGAGGSASESVHASDTRRLAASLTSSGAAAWTWEIGAQYSDTDFFVRVADVLVDRFELAIRGFGGAGCSAATGAAGVGPCAYFNPFGSALTGSGTRNSNELLDYLVGAEALAARSALVTADGVVTRELGDVGGGAAAIAVGAQYRGEKLSYDYDANANRDNFLFLIGNPDFGDERNVDAVFVELALPFGASLNLQVAARYEDYGRDVGSTDPKVTLLWRPAPPLSLRASVGTSFRAPSLFQAFGTQTTLAELVDPGVGSPQFFPVRTRPNPAGAPLQPEEAEVLDVGVTVAPGKRFNLSLDYWSFAYSSVIVEQNAQALLNAAARGDASARAQVVRDPASGLLVRVDSFYANASALETTGFDLAAKYGFALSGGGTLRVGVDGTYIATYDIEDPQSGRVHGAGRRNFANFGTSTPQWRANVSTSWKRDRHALTGFIRYIDSYLDDEVRIGDGAESFRRIDNELTVDAQYTLELRGAAAPVLSFGLINMFNAAPPRVATSGGYDSKVHDPRGRLWYAKALFEF